MLSLQVTLPTVNSYLTILCVSVSVFVSLDLKSVPLAPPKHDYTPAFGEYYMWSDHHFYGKIGNRLLVVI